MALKIRSIFIIGFLFFISFPGCDRSPSDSEPNEPEEPKIPESINISAPTASVTYWTDQAVACGHNQPDYADKTEWLVGDEPVACIDGELDTLLPQGEHTVTSRITDDGKSVESNVTIMVREGFSVVLDKPKADSNYFVGDEVSCSAAVTPRQYEDNLEITVGGQSCAGGSVQLSQAGAVPAVASVTVDGRSEVAEATLTVAPAIAGRVYPLTDQGVVSERAGFTVTLRVDGEVIDVETGADGTFSIKPDRISELSSQEVELEVAESGNFYGARAALPAEELVALVESDHLGFILAPKRWQIRCGPMAGESTTIKLPEAFARYERDNLEHYASFYMLMPEINDTPRLYRRWLPEDRPLLTAFNRERSEVTITAADSTAFWQETTRVEETICRGDLLRPATIAEVPFSSKDGVHIRAMTAGTGATGGARSDSEGHIKGGSIKLPIDNFGDSGSLRHELAQVFGFGEQNKWYGITSSNMSGPPGYSEHYSVDDVSHIQLYMDAVDLQAEEDISFGIYAWRQMFSIPSLPDN